jgi:predicted GNAT family acetyltransferase
MIVGGKLAGNVFGTRWVYEGDRKMLWITQLCVSSDFRNKGIAKKLLETLRQDERGFGILSSHPFAILAVLRVFGRGPDDVDLEMTRKHAREIMASCPVGYVKEAKLRGELFEGEVADGTVSCADTDFWVDHGEPLEALKIVREKGITWPFGELPDGHEFLVVVKAKASDHAREGVKSSEF